MRTRDSRKRSRAASISPSLLELSLWARPKRPGGAKKKAPRMVTRRLTLVLAGRPRNRARGSVGVLIVPDEGT